MFCAQVMSFTSHSFFHVSAYVRKSDKLQL